MVRKLNELELRTLANNFKLTNHARERLEQRLSFGKDIKKIKQSILNTALAYYNTDGSINIQVYDKEEYYVFVKEDNCYLMVTCKAPSLNGNNLFRKFYLASMNYSKKINC